MAFNPNLFVIMLADAIADEFDDWQADADQQSQIEQNDMAGAYRIRHLLKECILDHMDNFLRPWNVPPRDVHTSNAQARPVTTSPT